MMESDGAFLLSDTRGTAPLSSEMRRKQMPDEELTFDGMRLPSVVYWCTEST